MQTYDDFGEMHFNEYVRIIMSRKNVVIGFFVTIVSVVTVVSFLMQPSYRATVKLLIDIEAQQVVTASNDSVSVGNNYYAYKEYFESQKEIIQSRSIARKSYEILKRELFNGVDFLESIDPTEALMNMITVEPIRNTRFLLLHVDNKDPKRARDIANHAAKAYVSRNLSYITKNEVLNYLKNEYIKLQAKLSEYSKVYKHKHPKMIRLQQEIDQVVERMQTEKDRIDGYESSDTIPTVEESSASNSLLVGIKANNISIQDEAIEPRFPFKPNKRRNILLAMIIGFFGGIGLAFFLEYVDDTIKGADDIARIVQWPFLGNIPQMLEDEGEDSIRKDLFARDYPTDPISEAYRTVRTSILFSSTKEKPVKSILVTSPGPAEGKSVTVCNLALTMVQRESRVLLIDADMRKPRLHDVFNKKNEIGLSNFLAGHVPFKEIVQKSDIDNLSLVCAGPIPPNPSELLGSSRLKEFIREAENEFDFIFFDSAPVAVVTDSVIVSHVVDGVIIVLECGKTSRKVLPRIHQTFHDAGARVIGVLLNRIDITGSHYEYYSYYHKYYGSG
ncbi:MAG: polysaccharide biosynthesis tyrosine autokinase [Candidatus Omnitrophica bacterium]|nr:polysaccharide biosynthesis tyrosine autokinase [Candidatus Omnitrophota bacterium]